MTGKDIRERLIRIGRKAVKYKLVFASGGNISVRYGCGMYIKTKGARLDSSNGKNYMWADLNTGRRTAKVGIVPSAEKYMHGACYKARKDINAVLHFHPVFSTAVANSRIKLGPISYELLACLGSGILRAKYKPAGSMSLAIEIASLLKKTNAVLMPNHGLLTVGRDLDEAFERALAVERACQTLVFSRLLGLFTFLPKKEAKRIIAFTRP
ncbi:MAG: hypothetical protein A2Z72_01235 [Omnitrophica bacterium RBG_13_46_9]|nr:MAG: hypothetical protein A2Z72_01235 [Omnitrophica bacterium RBG_13_46_9]